MSLINPEPGAIPKFLWDVAQEDIISVLEEIRDNQAAINPDYSFEVKHDLYLPTIEDLASSNNFVNVYISTVFPEKDSFFESNQIVRYHIDNYVQGSNELDPGDPNILIPPDQAAVERLKYQVAMCYFAMKKLQNYYLKNETIFENKIDPGSLRITLNPVENAEDGATPYAPARITFDCSFPYFAQDLEDLPDLESVLMNLPTFSVRTNYTT